MSTQPTPEDLEALARKHGATSYRNRADTQNPAYGFTEDGLRNLLADAIARWGTPAPSEDAAIEGVIQDANRYRWLRRPLLHAGQGSIVVTVDDRANGKIDRVIYLEALDAAIDAARKEGK